MLAPIALTCGEPAGIGPEIVVKARQILRNEIPFFWMGDPRHLPPGSGHRIITTPAEAADVPGDLLPVLPHPFAQPATSGHITYANARGVVEVIARCVRLVQEGKASAICTAPIHKKALQDGAGFKHPGHTEYLAFLAGVDRVVMMLASPDLRVVPATIHIPIAEVPRQLTPALLEEVIRITEAGLRRDFGLPRPRIAVAGLNPHAGEDGAMGQEELRFIRPLIQRLSEEGMAIRGPLPADTMFHSRARATYDVAICMYHDQALIPIKTIDFDGGVNVTLGLPFVRSSPDHGTALDIAGKGIAEPGSLVAALRMAQKMATARKA
ncbi:MAG TPA: 4-hydroxythreonine-4-phosphate dehydrogenase PdxA [Gemmobacter sp.]|nr:MAG: 4-hydroxythreonine-4-phosphate dehydrogenase PdxA [Rhodobacteraceae bacterium GWF1_65_7]HBD89599.1 4-hydroxythreonine-4-phosphate dehydrogenase PdxA [Gemmobacter sp.]HBU16446.1 4-hydroxythreonine-4-phosphate dehydrogenase PdxA [Gemmobacter sp.]